MKRPILYWVCLFVLGEFIGKQVSGYIVGLVIVFAFVLFVILRYTGYFKNNDKIGRPKKLILLLVGVVSFFLGVFCMCSWERVLLYCEKQVGKQIQFQGQIIKREEQNGENIYVVNLTKLHNKKIKATIELKMNAYWKLGSVIDAKGTVKQFDMGSNPGAYNEKDYKQGNGIFVSMEGVEIIRYEEPRLLWREGLSDFQKYIAEIYEKQMEAKNASLACAMVLGDKRNLDADVKSLYQRNGIAHLIAISGLHIAMIGGMFYKLLRRLTGSYLVAASVGVIFIVAYGVMTGLSGATLRAIIMLITSLGADVFGRCYDGLTAIALALFIMLIKNPYQITQVGFLLSFGAVIGIVMIQPIWKLYFPSIPKRLDGLLVSISVQMVLLPILLYYFYEVPVYGIFLNMIVVPLMNWLLIFLILCGFIGMLSPSLANIPALFANGIFTLYEWVCMISESLPGHTWCTGKPSGVWMVFYYVFLIICVWCAYYRKKRQLCMGVVILVLLCVTLFLPTKLQICVFDVGQGDGIYIRTAHHKHLLVDGGSSTKKRVGNYVLKNGLKYYGGNQLDYVFVSHSDSDHYSGIYELLNEDLIQIKNLVMPNILNPDDSYQQLVNLAKGKGCEIYYIQAGDTLNIDDVMFRCLNPQKQVYEDKNAGSIVLQMTYQDFDMLFTGDFDTEGEKRIMQDIRGKIEVLKVAHHGSATASSKEFLQRLRPDVACVSVGEKNQYGHPAREVMERLEQFTEKIYLTKDCGAITIETDGKEYEICGSIRNGTH